MASVVVNGVVGVHMGQGMKSSKSGMKSDDINGTGRHDRSSSSSLAPRPLGLVGRRRGVVPAAATFGSPEIGDSDAGGVEIITPSQALRKQTQQSLDQQEQFSIVGGDSFTCCGPERQRPFSNYPLSDTPQPSTTATFSVETTSTTASDSHAMKGESPSSSSSSSSHDQQATLLSELSLVCEQVILPHDLVPDIPSLQSLLAHVLIIPTIAALAQPLFLAVSHDRRDCVHLLL